MISLEHYIDEQLSRNRAYFSKEGAEEALVPQACNAKSFKLLDTANKHPQQATGH